MSFEELQFFCAESNDDNIDSCLIIELTAEMQQLVHLQGRHTNANLKRRSGISHRLYSLVAMTDVNQFKQTKLDIFQ